MATRSLARRVVLPGWTAVVLLGGIVGSVTIEPDAAPAARPAAVSARGGAAPSDTAAKSPVAPAGSAPTTAAATEAAGVTAAPGPAPTTPAPGAAAVSAAGAADGPGQTTPPPPGTYRYHQTTTGSDGKSTDRDRTTTLTRVGQDGDSIVQHLTLPFSTGTGEASATATVAWGPKGVIVREWVLRLFGGSFTCDWGPDYSQYPPTLAVGATWTVDTSCSGKVSGGQLDGMDATMHQKGSQKITGTKAEQAAGHSVPTWTITGSVDIELTSGGISGTTHTEGSEQYAPSLGVPASADGTTTVDSFGQKKTSRTTLSLMAVP
jgi:hypothetical protein